MSSQRRKLKGEIQSIQLRDVERCFSKGLCQLLLLEYNDKRTSMRKLALALDIMVSIHEIYKQLLLFLFKYMIVLVPSLLFSLFLILTIVSIFKTEILQKENRLVLVRPRKSEGKSVYSIYSRKASFNSISTSSQSL